MGEKPQKPAPNWMKLLFKLILTAALAYVSYMAGAILYLLGAILQVHIVIIVYSMLLLPALLIPLVWFRNTKKVITYWGIFALMFLLSFGINFGMELHEKSITIDTAPNINIYNYMPFEEDSKIVRLDHEASLKFTQEEGLPIIDGAAAVFPVYSAFVEATYPNTVKLYELWYEHDPKYQHLCNAFQYNNTGRGYQLLADKQTDIFFGAYPSETQIETAHGKGTEFVYTPIGYEAFVFFVHKDNPVNNLTSEQVRGIYSGEITNWSQLGGRFEQIAAFQRNQGSGSQSMLERFMGDTPIMDPPKDLVTDLMSGIVELVSDYENRPGSIGYSYRYYLEGIVQNPDIKLLSIDGVAPTVENIQNGTYPIITPLYAVTWKGNENGNVQRLLDWVLSPEGQYIIEKTGYVPIGPTE